MTRKIILALATTPPAHQRLRVRNKLIPLRQEDMVAEDIALKHLVKQSMVVLGRTMLVCRLRAPITPARLANTGTLRQAEALDTACQAPLLAVLLVLPINIGTVQLVLQIPLLTPQIRQPLALRVAGPGIPQVITARYRPALLANTGTLLRAAARDTACQAPLLAVLLVLPINIGTVQLVLVPLLPLPLPTPRVCQRLALKPAEPGAVVLARCRPLPQLAVAPLAPLTNTGTVQLASVPLLPLPLPTPRVCQRLALKPAEPGAVALARCRPLPVAQLLPVQLRVVAVPIQQLCALRVVALGAAAPAKCRRPPAALELTTVTIKNSLTG